MLNACEIPPHWHRPQSIATLVKSPQSSGMEFGTFGSLEQSAYKSQSPMDASSAGQDRIQICLTIAVGGNKSFQENLKSGSRSTILLHVSQPRSKLDSALPAQHSYSQLFITQV